MTPQAIIFDLDGTLIHSAPDLHYAANEMLRALERAPLDLATVISFIGNGVPKLVARCLQATGGATAEIETKARELFLQTYAANMTRHTVLYPGVRAALDDFAQIIGRLAASGALTGAMLATTTAAFLRSLVKGLTASSGSRPRKKGTR